MPGGEVVDLVDETDVVIGTSTTGECIQRGLLHRAVAVIVKRTNGMYLLQQRSKSDRWQPGLWTLSSTGHVGKGEGYPEAASRELWEELQIRSPLRLVGKFLVPPISDKGLTEYEWTALFDTVTEARPEIDRNELEDAKDVTSEELGSMMASGALTQDSIFLLRMYAR